MKFSHLHNHTQYSLLDGASNVSKLYEKARKDGMPAIAITDHGNMFGAFDFVAEAWKKKKVVGKTPPGSAGVKSGGTARVLEKKSRVKRHLVSATASALSHFIFVGFGSVLVLFKASCKLKVVSPQGVLSIKLVPGATAAGGGTPAPPKPLNV